jgi:Secretion system C-terminal sorting domain
VYYRGAMIVSMLRAIAGDTKFYEACTNYLNDPLISYGGAISDDLRRNFETTINTTDLAGFFTDWVNGAGNANYALTWNNTGNHFVMQLAQSRTAGSTVSYFRMPVVVRVKNAGGTQDTTIVVYDNNGNLASCGNGAIGTYTGNNIISFDLSFTPVTIEFDPLNITMATGTVTFNPGLAGRNIFVATEEKPLQEKLTISPNPAHDHIVITIESLENAETVISLLDIKGVLLLSRKQNIVAGINPIRLDNLGKLVNGVYFVKITTGTRTETRKVIVQ